MAAKYSEIGCVSDNLFNRHGLPTGMAQLLAQQANTAVSSNTKSLYDTVKRNIVWCPEELCCNLDFPWSIAKTLHLVVYLLFTRRVKAKTASCQLSGV